MVTSSKEIKIYFITMPAHQFLHVKNYESEGYFDFWEKQKNIPGQDCDTVCGLLDSIKDKVDGKDGVIGKFSGQIMAHINEPDGKRAECYGVRLPIDFNADVPKQMLLIDVPEAEYIVFEHGPFDYEQENSSVGEQVVKAVEGFDYSETDYALDDSIGRMSFFYHDPEQFYKHIKPVKKK
jgi:hypothetical protein